MKYLSLKDRKIIIIGFGSIGPAVLPLILRHIDINPDQIEIITANDVNRQLAEQENVKFECFKLTQQNYEAFLSKRLNPGDILLNLSVKISSLDLIRLSQKQGALYLDTSEEMWPSEHSDTRLTTFDRRNKILEEKFLFGGSTALICHGANPGLITHFAKRAILDVAMRENSSYSYDKSQKWGAIAQKSGVVALHISEKDSQIATTARNINEYVNTWSIPGFLTEASECATFAWGSHEAEIPKHLIKKRLDTDKCHMIELNLAGAAVQLRSWAPSCGNFDGFVIPHPEAFSIAELLTFTDKSGTRYQPTVLFAYLPCNDALASLCDVLNSQRVDHVKQNRLLLDDIIDGMEELGILVLRKQTSEIYWYGSRLSINEVRSLAPNNNATSLQVAAGILSGLIWIIENPCLGLIEAEQVDFERALEIAAPYLGTLGGEWSTWPHSAESLKKENDEMWNFSELAINLT